MSTQKNSQSLQYLSGFGNHFSSEAEKGALPTGQNSPQKIPYGLYAEQISGTAFLSSRAENKRSWFYRIRPSVLHSSFIETPHKTLHGRPFEATSPNEQMRWDPLQLPRKATDFIDGLVTMAGNGDLASLRGGAVHIYLANRSMEKRFFYNADGELLIVPEMGSIKLRTEFGIMIVSPGEIAVVPCGIKFQVLLLDEKARGYVCENYGPALRLPELGPIGANGLANPRHFLTPTAHYEDELGDFELVAKFQSKLWTAKLAHSPLDVVAWHGNYVPYKYDLNNFQVIGSLNFDHCDPSIFTVLTAPSELPGLANLDFIIFPARWTVAEHTFRPAYYHRNCMNEFMGLIWGEYEAKHEGFLPGGASLHNKMLAHGPDAQTYEEATKAKLKPEKLENTLAIMFESSLVFQPTKFALKNKQSNYLSCWKNLKSNFLISPSKRSV